MSRVLVSHCTRAIVAACAALGLWLAVAAGASAAPGDLDETFSEDGKVVVEGGDYATPLAISTAQTATTTLASGPGASVRMHRLDSAGLPDPALGGVAGVQLDLAGLVPEDAVPVAGGGFAVTGMANPVGPGEPEPGVALITPAGTLDPSFGEGGVATAPFAMRPGSIAIHPDGGFVIAGRVPDPSPGPETEPGTFAFGRLDAEGDVVAGFAGDGEAEITVPNEPQGFGDLAVNATGAIFGTGSIGSSWRPGDVPRAAVMALDSDGTPNEAFSGDGLMLLDSSADRPEAEIPLELGLSGGGVTVGYGFCQPASWPPYCRGGRLTRLTSAGEPDVAFGAGGSLDLDPPEPPITFSSMAGDAAGRFTAAGTLDDCRLCNSPPRLYLTQATAAGAIDMHFGRSGLATISMSTQVPEGPPLIAHDPAGRIILMSTLYSDLAVARLEAAPGPADADADGKVDPQDRCPLLWAQDRSGCPRHGASIRLFRLANPRGLRTWISADPGCDASGRKVKLLRVRSGKDRRVRTATADDQGYATFERLPAGRRYRATMPAFVQDEVGLCGPARSKAVRLKQRRR